MPPRTPKPVPTPVAAALGIVPTVVDRARRLPGKAVQLPVLAVSAALTALETAKKEYDELAGRGERLVAHFRGESLDTLEDHVEDLVRDTPLARPYDAAEDAVEDAVAKVSELLDRAADRRPPAGPAPRTEPDTAATPAVVATVEAVAASVPASGVTSHGDLPLADYDHLTLGSLRGRLRSLSVPELVQVRDYEKAHAHRLPVITLLDNRIAKLATDASATPSPGGGEVLIPTPETKATVTQATAAKAAPPRKATPRTKVRTT